MSMGQMIEKREAEHRREAEGRLQHAIERSSYAMISVLLDRGVNPNAVGSYSNAGMSMLHIAAARGDAGAVLMLLEKGATMGAKSYTGATPLMLAAKHENQLAAKLLIERGADVNARDYTEATPLHFAAEKGRAEVCAALIAAGAYVHVRPDNNQSFPLHLAAESGSAETCRVLLSAGVRLDRLNLHNETALHLAAKKGHLDVCRLLVENGANPDHLFHKVMGLYSSRTPCQEAAKHGQADVVRFFLLQCGSDPNLKSRLGETLTEIAKGNAEVMAILRSLDTQAKVAAAFSEAAHEEIAPVQRRSSGMSPL